MDFNITQIFITFGLITVIIIQAIAHYFTIETGRLERETLKEEREKLLAAVLAKNTQEYTDIIRAEKTPSTPQVESDEVLLSEADEETFNKYITNQA